MPTKPPQSPSSPWDKEVIAAIPAPTPTAPEAAGLKPPMWMGRPITHAEHAQDLDQEAAINEFGPSRMHSAAAEEQAYKGYVQRQHTEAAAHHLSGMRSAHAAGDMESARKHSLMYGVHSKALGHDPIGPAHPAVAAHLEGNPGKVRFKPHRGDLFAIQKPPVAPEEGLSAGVLGKALHTLWKGASALLKGDVVKFPGNPKPAQDKGHEASVSPIKKPHQPGPSGRAARPYKCTHCGHVQSETTNHTGPIHSRCDKCSWKGGVKDGKAHGPGLREFHHVEQTEKGELKANKPKPCVCPAYSHPHRYGGGKCGK